MEASITKPALSAIDQNLDRFDANEFNLLVELSINTTSCCLMNNKKQMYGALEQVNFMNNGSINNSFLLFKKYFNDSFFSSIKYSQSVFVIASEFYTLVPQALYSASNAKDVLTFNAGIDFEFEVGTMQIPILDSVILFAIPSAVKLGIESTFPDAQIVPHAFSLISESMLLFKNSTEESMLVHVQNGRIDVLVVKNHKMIFFNSFKFVTTEDVVYYILMVCETLKISPENIALKLCGEIEKKSAIYTLLNKYIRTIEFLSSNKHYKYSGGYSPLPSHFFFNLINTAHCVL